MVDAVEANISRRPEEVSANSGLLLDANLAAIKRAVDAYVTIRRAQHPTDGEGGAAHRRHTQKDQGRRHRPVLSTSRATPSRCSADRDSRGFHRPDQLDKVAPRDRPRLPCPRRAQLAQGRILSAVNLTT